MRTKLLGLSDRRKWAGYRLPLSLFLAFLLTVATLSVPPQTAAEYAPEENVIEEAVILIEVTSQHPDWYSPWQGGNISRGSGSGFLIGKGRVMTNAHVISDARQILLRRSGRITPVFAEVEFVAHDADLAILKVREPNFDEGVAALEFGDLPSIRTRVRTYGYPVGGEQISRTEGVISRLEFVTYVHSGADAHMAIQTDSAINPGNSGGPVVQDGKVVGVAFQTNTRLNDVGYFIPTPVVRRFLRDIEDGTYDGYAELGLITSNLFNPSYRSQLGLSRETSGVVVDRVLPGSSAVDRIEEQDVIVAIEGYQVENDGTIHYRGHQLDLEQAVEDKQVGESVTVSLIRGGKPRTVEIPLQTMENVDRLRHRFDTPPEYLIYAGLVFMELDQEYLSTFGNYWAHAGHSLLYQHFYHALEQTDGNITSPVVLTRVLSHATNSAYLPYANSIVARVNGIPINALGDLNKAIAIAGEYHLIELDSGTSLVLDRKVAERAHLDILETYGIDQNRSAK